MIDKLRLEWIDPKTLTPNPANWRRHPKVQKDALKAVIGEVGWAGALLFNDATGRLIDGHLRQEISHDGPVPVLIGSWTEEQERLILATLDPIAALAEAESSALDALLKTVETESEAVKALLERIAEQEGIDLGEKSPEHSIGTGGRLYHHDIEIYKLAYRVEAAWQSRGNLALDLFSGEGQLAEWYKRRFERVITVDCDKQHAVDFTMKAGRFIQEYLANGFVEFDFVDFDDEGSPARDIKIFFDCISGVKQESFVLAFTDGNGLNLKLRGRYNPAMYLAGEDRVRQATARDYDDFENTVTGFIERCATETKFIPSQLSSYRARKGDVVYQTWLISV